MLHVVTMGWGSGGMLRAKVSLEGTLQYLACMIPPHGASWAD